MAKLVDEQIESRAIRAIYPVWKVTLLGVTLGILYWVLTALISRYLIEVLLCGPTRDADICDNPIGVAGDIAMVIVAVVGLFVMVRTRLAQPLLVVAASAIALWGLARWTESLFWLEAVAWSTLLYALSYTVFGWISRYRHYTNLLVIAVIIVVLVRLATTL